MARKGKANRTGRNERHEHFTQLFRHLMEQPAWRALSSSAQALYPWLRLEWKGADANNNGAIRLSARQAAERLGVTRDTANKAFQDLQAKGLITVTECAHLGVSGAGKGHFYELTEIALPRAAQRGGRRLYEGWREGHDFPVQKAAVHNPTGSNGRAKPRHENHDSTVTEAMTVWENAS